MDHTLTDQQPLPLLLAGGRAAAVAAALAANAPAVATARRCATPYEIDGRIRLRTIRSWSDLAIADRHPDVIVLGDRLAGSEQRIRPALIQHGWQYGSSRAKDRVHATGWWTSKLSAVREADHGWYAPIQRGMIARRDHGGRLRFVDRGGPTRIREVDERYWDRSDHRLYVVPQIDVAHWDYTISEPMALPHGPWGAAVTAVAAVATVPDLRPGDRIDPGRVRHLSDFAAGVRGGQWRAADWIRGHRATPALRDALASLLRTSGWTAEALAIAAPHASDARLAALDMAIADEAAAQAQALEDYIALAA